jgi:hypothetical protein
MANITKYLEKKLLEQSVGKITNFSIASGTYVALFTQSPTVNYVDNTAEDGVEVSGASYTRKQITWGNATASTDLTNSSSIKNSDSIAWNNITSSWGTVTTVGVFDSSTVGGGNLLWFGPLSTSITLITGDTFTIQANSLTLTLG